MFPLTVFISDFIQNPDTPHSQINIRYQSKKGLQRGSFLIYATNQIDPKVELNTDKN